MDTATRIRRRASVLRTCAVAGALAMVTWPAAAQSTNYVPPTPRVSSKPLVPVATRVDPDRQRALGGPFYDFRHPSRARAVDGTLENCVDVRDSKLVAARAEAVGPLLRIEVLDSSGTPSSADVFVFLDNPRTACAILRVDESGVLETRLLKPRRNQTVEVAAPGHRVHATRLDGAARALGDRRLFVQLEVPEDVGAAPEDVGAAPQAAGAAPQSAGAAPQSAGD